MKQLFLARHMEVLENVQKIILGWQDGTPTQKGERQAFDLGYHLKDRNIEYIITATTYRQQRTGELANRSIKLPPSNITTTQNLRERGAGSLEGKSYKQLGVVTEEDFNLYDKDGSGIFTPIEPLENALKSAAEAIRIIQELPAERILAIGSGWKNSYITNILLGEGLIYHHQENCMYHEFWLKDDNTILAYNLNNKTDIP